MVVFGQVRMQAHAILARQRGRVFHQLRADAKRRARRHRHLGHRAVGGVVVALDHPLRIFQDRILALDQAIGWQAALRLSQAHAAARRYKAHAHGARCFYAVV